MCANCNLTVLHKRDSFHVWIVGRGPVRNDIKQCVVELGIDQMVTFSVHVDYVQVIEGIATETPHTISNIGIIHRGINGSYVKLFESSNGTIEETAR